MTNFYLAPPEAVGISVDFKWFDLLDTWDYMHAYSMRDPDPSALLDTLTGPGKSEGQFNISTTNRELLLTLGTDYFGYLSDGFGAAVSILCTCSFSFLEPHAHVIDADPPPLTWIKYNDAVAIVFVILNSLALLIVVLAAIAILYRYRKIFVRMLYSIGYGNANLFSPADGLNKPHLLLIYHHRSHDWIGYPVYTDRTSHTEDVSGTHVAAFGGICHHIRQSRCKGV